METIVITLRITTDQNSDNDSPEYWDWPKVLDLGPNETCTVEKVEFPD